MSKYPGRLDCTERKELKYEKFIGLLTAAVMALSMPGCVVYRERCAGYDGESDNNFRSRNPSGKYGNANRRNESIRDCHWKTEETASVSETTAEKLSVEKDGSYTTPEDVAEYIHTFGTLPNNFITKSEAKALGWDNKKGNLWDVAEEKA